MPFASRLLPVAAALGLAGCQAVAPGTSYPPLPGPSPDVEVVAVSPAIATRERPVFYYRDPADSNRLLAYDWTGTLRGSLTATASEPFGAYPSLDGTVVLLMHAHLTSGGQVVGRVANGIWAGDDAHLCTFLNELVGPGAPRMRQVSAGQFEGIDTPGALFYESTTCGARRLLGYGQFGPHGGPAVIACSAANDRAVIAQSFVADLSSLQIIRLSDGQVTARGPSQPSSGPGGVVVSADGTLAGVGSTGGISVGGGGDAFTVFRLPGNAMVAHITGGGIEAFSADDTRALIVEDVGGSNEHRTYQLIDLATSRSLWSAVLSPGTVLARPGTGDFLVASRTYEPSLTRTNSNDPFEDVWLVSASGAARLLLKHAVPLS